MSGKPIPIINSCIALVKNLYRSYQESIDHVIQTNFRTSSKAFPNNDQFRTLCLYIRDFANRPLEDFQETEFYEALLWLHDEIVSKRVSLNRIFGAIGTKKPRNKSKEVPPKEYQPKQRRSILEDPQENVPLVDPLGLLELSESENSFLEKPAKSRLNIPAKNHFERISKKVPLNVSINNIPQKFEMRFEKIPSFDRSERIASKMDSLPWIFKTDSSGFQSQSRRNLFDSSISRKHVGPRFTWMFDIIYFNDHDKDKSRFLLGININSRYAVGRELHGKTVKDIIEAFEEILQEVTIKSIIFDGEPGISSQEFTSWTTKNKIKLRVTASKIHTQTAPIDRLCRTIRRYWFKWYVLNDPSYDAFDKLPYKRDPDKLLEKMLRYRHLFKKGSKEISQIPHEEEFRELLFYYNHHPHKGLRMLFESAADSYPDEFQLRGYPGLDFRKITPYDVHVRPYLEYIIVKYCVDFNNSVELPKRKIGDVVRIYNVLENYEGSLQPNVLEMDPNEYVIKSINGGFYRIISRNGDERNISEYMIVKS